MSGMSVIMTIMQDAARKASRNLLRDFNEVEHLQIARKGPKDFVNRVLTRPIVSSLPRFKAK